jgi:superfamily II DNA helicase RecQ
MATILLGMGMNIQDVKRVIVWNFPCRREPADVWQRVGRGGHGEGHINIAYIFLLY